jgi:hypothetical protein
MQLKIWLKMVLKNKRPADGLHNAETSSLIEPHYGAEHDCKGKGKGKGTPLQARRPRGGEEV